MRNFNEKTITDAVIQRFSSSTDPRIKEVCTSLVKHLHDFVRDIRPSYEEWEYAIDFLTRTGKICDGNRQEFILLSDTLGVSMLVDAVNNPTEGPVTQSTVLGPFFVEDAEEFALGANIAGGMKGLPAYVSGSVSSEDGSPIAGAAIDVWHSDDAGFYDVQQLETLGGNAGRGRFYSDENGKFHFWTIKPTCYPVPTDGPVGEMLTAQGRHPWRPAHLHYMIQAPGHRKLVTHIFDRADQYLDSDAVFGVKDELVRDYVDQSAGVAPDGTKRDAPYCTITYEFVMAKKAARAA
ncbi:MAG: hydroxyquinol 1,2-dioxygenase [Hyphomicrobiales bacterium]|nr:hydroxyquinol 1,2-dioxygenase [Hyphomicrobiales bacterium]